MTDRLHRYTAVSDGRRALYEPRFRLKMEVRSVAILHDHAGSPTAPVHPY